MKDRFDRQFQDLINKIDKQNEYFSNETETLKKNQIELLEMKNTLKETKNEIGSLGNRAGQMEKRISDIEDKNLEMTQKEET